MSYVLLRLTNVGGPAEEWLSDHAFDYGALGISERLAFDQPEGEEDVFTRDSDARAIDVYFDATPAPEFLEQIGARYPAIELRVTDEQDRDWLAEWKKSFAPFALTGDHWIVPSWCEAPAAAKHKIWIDPGMAFGTGTHETTRLMAHRVREITRDQKINSALDVGTGTGILAILARQLGVAHVTATELEVDARRVARENFDRNETGDVILDHHQIEDLGRTFDLVMANIIDGVLVRLNKVLLDSVAPGGWLVVSGIINVRDPDFRAGFKLPAGVEWTTREIDGDWLLYAVKL